MKAIMIYGCGSKALTYLPALALNYEIQGFIESEVTETDTFLGKPLITPSKIQDFDFEFIVIASSYQSIIAQTLESRDIRNYVPIEDLADIYKQAPLYHQHLGELQESIFAQIKSLSEEHIKNTELLLNRKALLSKLPKYISCAELGVASGDFTKLILDTVHPSSLHLVDKWGSARYGEPQYQKVKKLQGLYKQSDIKIHRTPSIEAVSDFEDASLDFIYIDTTHGYQTTRQELELYHPKVKATGLLAGHDYSQGNWCKRSRYGVIEAVYDFCASSNWRIKYLTMDLKEKQSFALERI